MMLPSLELRSEVGLEQKNGPLFAGLRPVVGAGCLTGVALPPSPPDHHSVEPKPGKMGYKKMIKKHTSNYIMMLHRV